VAWRTGLLKEILVMSLDTVRSNKMRSGLTVLGVVIGITSIVGMTSIIRGFDESLRDIFRQLGPKTMFIAKFSAVSFAAGREFRDLIRRPNISPRDAELIAQLPSVETVAVQYGGGVSVVRERISYGNNRTKMMVVVGASAEFARVNSIPITMGRMITEPETRHRRRVTMLGYAPAQALFPQTDPIGKHVRIGNNVFEVVGTFDKRPAPPGLVGVDEFVVIPHTTYEKAYGLDSFRIFGIVHRDVMIAVVPREDVSRDEAMADVEEVLRVRHNLRLDQENDFDIVTQDAIMKVWDQFSRAIILALIVISSIALMVGGIGVMAIMTISVTERTREIGVRKALGARRREILWQFLLEAVFLTSVGGILGILIGSSIGLGINVLSGFPVSLPWWSFLIGLGFSATVGIFFGIVPAMKAARLDPIEALRYE